MTTTIELPTNVTARRVPTDPASRTTSFGGLFHLVTFASSIPAMFRLDPTINDTHYVLKGLKPSAGTMLMARS
jgi:hypothetical protein